MHFYLPKQAVLCIETIEKAGYEAWAVGGCVRDQLLGIEPKDVDIASNAPPEEILRIFERALPTGLQHGTVTVLLQGVPVEVTRFRLEGGYIDSRRPGWVAPAHCVQEDLARRDFTINAMAWHPEHGLLDPFGGQADLVAKTIRTVGTPLERFEEDAFCAPFVLAPGLGLSWNQTPCLRRWKTPIPCKTSAGSAYGMNLGLP